AGARGRTAASHDLRHTAAPLLLRGGISPKIVSAVLGHATISMTLDRYSHVLPDLQDAATSVMDRLLGSWALEECWRGFIEGIFVAVAVNVAVKMDGRRIREARARGREVPRDRISGHCYER